MMQLERSLSGLSEPREGRRSEPAFSAGQGPVAEWASVCWSQVCSPVVCLRADEMVRPASRGGFLRPSTADCVEASPCVVGS